MVFEAIIFFIAAAFALFGALAVVVVKNPFYNVLALVTHLIALATLFLLLRGEFIAAAQVVVYAGAVMVLYLFVVAYIGGADEPLGRGSARPLRVLGPVLGAVLALEIAIAVIASDSPGLTTTGAALAPGFGSPAGIGGLLLTEFLLSFEAASFLLTLAAVGAVVLARRRRGLEDERYGRPATIITHQQGASGDERPDGRYPPRDASLPEHEPESASASV